MAEEKDDSSSDAGCGIGSLIAIFLSYAINQSFWWAVLHMLFGWTYIVYALFFRFHDIVVYFKDAAK